MDTFDKQWKLYILRSTFFQYYNVPFPQHKQFHHGLYQLMSWYEHVLRSQFENSIDRCDRISLIHWIVEVGNRDDFVVENHFVPFHAIVKTPIMEYWYAHPEVTIPYTGQTRRIPLFDEHRVIRPYYHTKFECSVLNRCVQFKNCNNQVVPTTTSNETDVVDCERLAEEVF